MKGCGHSISITDQVITCHQHVPVQAYKLLFMHAFQCAFSQASQSVLLQASLLVTMLASQQDFLQASLQL